MAFAFSVAMAVVGAIAATGATVEGQFVAKLAVLIAAPWPLAHALFLMDRGAVRGRLTRALTASLQR